MSSQPPLDTVLKQARQALKARPKDAALHRLVAPLYEQLERYAEALPHLSFLISSENPPEEALYLRYAKALSRTGNLAKAWQVLGEGAQQHPHSAALLRDSAFMLALLGRLPEAQETYRRVRALAPGDRHDAAMAGCLALLASNMAQGHEDYAQRPQNEALEARFARLARWRGEPLAGKKIVLWPEQGIGDTVMFLGLLPWLLACGAQATVVVTQKLAPLVSRAFPSVGVVHEETQALLDAQDFDCHAPLGDLFLYGFAAYKPAAHPPYLKADEAARDTLRGRYLDYAKARGRSRLIGLSWHTTNPKIGFTRNITLAQLRPVLSVPGVQFVSLQYGDHAQEIAQANASFRDILLSDPAIDAFGDVDALAAQMGAMDHIITIDNAAAHLAGALGVKTTLLLCTLPDWRWGLSGTANGWYASVSLERQTSPLDWQAPIKRLRAVLLLLADA